MKVSKWLPLFIFLWGCESKKSDLIWMEGLDKNNIKIQISDKTEAENAKSTNAEKIKTIQDILKPVFDPYVGEVDKAEKCRTESLPPIKEQNSEKGFYSLISLYSSPQQVLGQCLNPEDLVKTQHLFLYCQKSKKQFVIKYFYPDEKDWILEPVAQCP